MKPVPRTHSEYQSFISQHLNSDFSFSSIVPADRLCLYKLWCTDLSQTDLMLIPLYSDRGPLPRIPSDLLRSYLLMILTKTFSITKWIDQLKRVPFYAVLSGFHPDDIPGIGTFYDFFDRLWLSDSDNFLPNERHRFKKPPKGKKKGEKAPTISKDKVAKIIKRITKQPLTLVSQPFDLLFDLFKSQFVQKSCQLGLLLTFFPLPVTVRLLLLLPNHAVILYVIAVKTELLAANANAITSNPTVIPDGIVHAKSIIMDTPSICLQSLLPLTVCLYTQGFIVLPNMTLFP